MSRTGKKPIPPVSGVAVTIDGRNVTAKGPKGELSMTLMELVEARGGEHGIEVTPANDSKEARAAWGTARALINNMVQGVAKGYQKKLTIQGVGYRAAMQGKDLKLSVGLSHEVVFDVPQGITVAATTPTEITVSGIDRQQVGQVAANIRSYRPPEPYQGKGIRYSDEYVARKEGKKK
jgi:large subunit ribosomal protein L6